MYVSFCCLSYKLIQKEAASGGYKQTEGTFTLREGSSARRIMDQRFLKIQSKVFQLHVVFATPMRNVYEDGWMNRKISL